MKILEYGNKASWETKQKCDANGWEGLGCGAKLLIDAEDIFISERIFIDGSSENYFTFTCPVCGQNSDICKSEIPEKVRSYILKRPSKNEGCEG